MWAFYSSLLVPAEGAEWASPEQTICASSKEKRVSNPWQLRFCGPGCCGRWRKIPRLVSCCDGFLFPMPAPSYVSWCISVGEGSFMSGGGENGSLGCCLSAGLLAVSPCKGCWACLKLSKGMSLPTPLSVGRFGQGLGSPSVEPRLSDILLLYCSSCPRDPTCSFLFPFSHFCGYLWSSKVYSCL